MCEEEALQTLLKTKVFRGLTVDDLKLFCRYFEQVVVKEMDLLIEEGQLRKALYVIIKGQCHVFLPRQIKGQRKHRITEVPLAVLKAGDCFGEFSLLDDEPASASVVATQPSVLIKLTKPVFDTILKSNDHIAKIIYYNLVQILIKRFRETEKEYSRSIMIE